MAAELKSIISVYGRMDGSFTALSRKIKSLGSTISGIGTAMTALTVPVVMAVKDSIDLYTDFDDVLRQIQATGGYNATVMEKIAASTRQAGRDTRFMATDAANAFLYLTQAGIGYTNVIDILPGLLNTASAGGMDLATTADLLISNLYSLGIAFSKNNVRDYTDAMVVAADATNTTAQELMEAVSKTGALGTWLGNTDELLTWMGMMSNINRKGAEAGTDMRNMLINLLAPTDKAGKLMESLGYAEEDVADAMEDINLKSSADAIEKLGVKVIDPATGKMRSLYAIMTDFNAAMKGMDAGESMDMLYTIFGKRTAPTVAGLLEQLEKYPAVYRQVLNSMGATEEKAQILEGGIGGKTRALASAVEELQLAVGKATEGRVSEHLETLRGVILGFAEAVDGVDPAAAGDMLDTVLGIAGSGVGLTIAGKALEMIGTAMLKIPTPGGKLALTAFALYSIADAIAKIGTEASSYENIEAFFSAAGDMGAGFVDKVADGISNGLDSAAKITGAVSELFTQINAEGWGAHIGTAGKDILKAIATAISGEVQLEENPLDGLRNDVLDAIFDVQETPNMDAFVMNIGAGIKQSMHLVGDVTEELIAYAFSPEGIADIVGAGIDIGFALSKGVSLGLYSAAEGLFDMMSSIFHGALRAFGIQTDDAWKLIGEMEFARGSKTATGANLRTHYLQDQQGTVIDQAAAYAALLPFAGEKSLSQYTGNFNTAGVALAQALMSGMENGMAEGDRLKLMTALAANNMADGLTDGRYADLYHKATGEAMDVFLERYGYGMESMLKVAEEMGIPVAKTLEEQLGSNMWQQIVEEGKTASEMIADYYEQANAQIDKQTQKTKETVSSAYEAIQKEAAAAAQTQDATGQVGGVTIPMPWDNSDFAAYLDSKYQKQAEIPVEVQPAAEEMQTVCEEAQEVAAASPTTLPTDVESAGEDVLAVCAAAQEIANANGVTIPVSMGSVSSKSLGGGANANNQPGFLKFAEGGRATAPSIFGEAGAEWAIPEEHTQRTADLLASAARASGFTMKELIARTGGLGANAGATAQFVFSPTIYANDVHGVEEALVRGKEEMEDWFERWKRDEERMSYA